MLKGYIRSILDYERGPMLCIDLSHKILRTETVLEALEDIVGRFPRNFVDIASKRLIGQFVVTR